MSDGFNGEAEEQGWGQESRTFSRGRGGGGRGGRGDGRGRGRGRGGAWGGDDRGSGGYGGGQQQWRDNRSQNGSWRSDRPRGEGGDSWGQDDRSGGGRGDWGGRGRGGGGGYGKPRFGDDSESTTMEVPSNMVGKIIGRGGSKITELQSESCTRIQVTKEEHDDNTVIKLMGSEENMQKAKSLIEELISERRDNY